MSDMMHRWAALVSLTEAGLDLGRANHAARLAGLPQDCRDAIVGAAQAVSAAHNMILAYCPDREAAADDSLCKDL